MLCENFDVVVNFFFGYEMLFWGFDEVGMEVWVWILFRELVVCIFLVCELIVLFFGG